MKKIVSAALILYGFGTTNFGFAGEEDFQLTEGIIERGQKEFVDTCALCHGENAKGNGPLAEYLVVNPPDLTQITLSYDGEFPFLTIYHIVEGENIVSAHGSRKMPVWGSRFKEEYRFGHGQEGSSERAETYAFGKIMELIVYLHSIQE